MLFSVAGTGFAAGSPSSVAEVESQPTASLGSGEPAAVTAAAGDVLYRANAGGSFTADGNQWDPLVDYQVAGEDETSSHGQPSTIHSSVPAGTPSQIWETERWDPDDGEEMQYEFDVASGQQVEVRLYFYDGYSGTSSTGDRVFDVAVEGQTVLDDFDIIETYGDDTGAMESFTVTSDGTVDVDFGHVTENPQVNAIEIVSTEAQPNTLGGPSSADFGTVVTGNTATETVTLTNLGNASNDSHPDITVNDISLAGADPGQFSHDFSGSATLAPGESTDVQVTYAPGSAQAHAATLEVAHGGANSPLTVDLTGEGSSDVPIGFGSSVLQGFGQGSLTALEFGPDGRLYVAKQNGVVYALNVTRNGPNDYTIESQETIDAVQNIPNHDDNGTYVPGESSRQVTGLTVGGTASEPVVYVSSSDPTIDVGTDDDDTDTNSGSISKLAFDWNSDGTLASVDHTVTVLGLPRSEENHATNGLDLSDDGDTLYVAQGGHTNKGAPGDNFGHTPEYALSAAVLSIDLAQIETNYNEKNLQNYDSNYPSVDFLYAIPTIQNDDATDGDDLPFGGNDGVNMAKWVEDGPVQVYSSGYRNPYDLVLSEDDQLYVIDNGPNGGWGGQPVNEGPSGVCTNEPNEDGSYGTGDQLHLATQGSYGGHAAPIRANPTGADIYDANGNMIFDINSSNSPVPASLVNPVECDYQDPTEDNSIGDTFGWTGGMDEYTASNFGGAMQGDLLVVEGGSNVERVELNATGTGVTNQENNFFTPGSALGIAAQGDEGPFPGTVWTARGDVTVFEPNDYGGAGDGGDTCSGADDPQLDEDGDGYDNADEIDAGTDPCSAASTPADFDDDGTSNLNDPDDDNDGIDDTQDLFAVDPDNGATTSLPIQMEFTETKLFGAAGQGWTGLMMNGSDYQDLYDPGQMTVGGAAQVLTVENVPQSDAHQNTNTQAFAFQRGFNASAPFTVETTVNGLPSDAEPFQSQGIFIGTGDQDNYAKLTVTGFSSGSGSGVQLATEDGGGFTDVANPTAPTAGNTTTLSMTVYPSNGTVEAYYTMQGGSQQFVGETTVPTTWFDTADGNGTAVGVISTSNGASSTFDATWADLAVEYVSPPTNQPPVADAGSDVTVDEGATVTLDASGSTDPDGDDAALGYTWTQTAGTPSDLLDVFDSEQVSFTAPDVDGDTTYTFDVTVSDGQDSDTDTVNVTVQDTDSETPSDGDVVYRVNAGGGEISASDGGPVWSADTDSSPSQYVNADGDNGLNSYNTGDTITLDSSVPSSTPMAVFQTERYDVNTSGSAADDTEMQWSLPAQQGATYEVRLYFAEIFLDSSNVDAQGPRTFDVVVEGETKLDDYNLYDQYGHDYGVVESYEVTPSDGNIDIEFLHEQENPKISAIEVVKVSDSSDETVTINEAVAQSDDTGNDTLIEFTEVQTAINWWQTDAEVPNTGGQQISFQKIQEIINLWQTDATVGGESAAPSIQITSPSEGETVTGDSLTATWETSGAMSSDHVHVILDDQPYVGGQSLDGSYTFENVTPGAHTVTVQVADTSHNVYENSAATDTVNVTVEEAAPETGSALVEITPDSGLEATTYGSGTYQVTNTGEKNITSVSFDLSTASYPDMVFDPQGTAGDPTGEGLNIVDEGGTGITTAEGGSEAFSQPQNGQNADDGYQVMTVEFDDFQNGEQATFWADNDPTSIKGATVGSQEAGPVSGLELAGSTVTVTYEDGTTHTTQLMGDGSAGGSTANVTADEAPAPTIAAQGVTLDSGVIDTRHSAATVTSASQSITVTGQPGATVTLLRAEGELTLTNVPDADGSGDPGYKIETYEANDAEDVEYYTATLDTDGEATIPVTLTNTTSDGDNNAGLNYFTAVQGEPNADAGLASNVVVLELVESVDDGNNTAPSIENITDIGVAEGGSATVEVNASDADGDALSLSVSGPSFVSIADDGDGTGTVTVAPGTDTVGTHTVTVTADDGSTTTSEEFAVYVDEPDQNGTVVFATNAGGSQYTADDGTTYQADTNFDGGSTYSFGGDVTGTDDDTLYQTERYGGSFGYDVPVDNGTYEVTLQFAEIYQGVSSQDSPDSAGPADGTNENDRLFDVAIEGQTVVSSYDIYSEVGSPTATEKTYTVEVTDGTLNVDFSVVNDNAKISALTVEQLSSDNDGGGSSGAKSADIAVNENSGIDASTYNGGSFEVTNTGDQQISSVTIDLSESLIPDAVFDPQGTAGDAGAKGLSVDSESGDGVGVVSTADGDVFSQAHNGQNGDDGYDAMTVEFTDFDPGETVGFSVDIDPTAIKDASTTGGAGSVSGLELAGSAVALGYADGSTQTTDLFGDGSAGGAQATADESVSGAPTLGVDGVSLQSTDFPAHEAATVNDSTQTLTVSGPTDATVQLIQVEASEPPSDGYDLDDFEADTAESVSYQSVALDSNGQATVSVTLTESNLNYFLAVVEDADGTTGLASNTVVLDYETSTSTSPQVLHRVNAGESATLSATDDGPDWTGVADTSSPYLVSVAPSASGSYCGGTISSTTTDVPSSTPDGVFDCERYGNATWEFSVDTGQEVEVRLYLGNQFSGTSEPVQRQYNVSIEGTQVLSNYDPVADVGHATGTMKSFAVTDDGDGNVTVTFDQGAAENPQVNAIEIVETEGDT